jgi:uncharacterized protein (TIGR02678 family)
MSPVARATRIRPARPSRALLPTEAAAERRRAIRALLASPILVEERADPEDWAAVRRHFVELRDWFAERVGWQLQFDGRSGIARLRKQVGWTNADETRGAVAPGQTHRPFERRAYVLFCLACAELDRTPGLQTLLTSLAERVTVRSATEGLRPFRRESYAERFALVDALRLLEQMGVLRLTEGDTERFVEETGDALYTIDRDRLGRLVATPRVPSVATDVRDLVRETYPDTREGRARRTRHSLMRRLLDDPVVYEMDLDQDELTYLRSQRAPITAWLREAGLELERRSEGAAAIDPPGDLTDEDFPAGGTFGHAALLAAEFLAQRGRDGNGVYELVAWSELRAFAAVLIDQNRSHWRASVTSAPDGPDQLVEEIAARLVMFALARRQPDGLTPLPAVGRWRSTELNAVALATEQLALDSLEGSDGR